MSSGLIAIVVLTYILVLLPRLRNIIFSKVWSYRYWIELFVVLAVVLFLFISPILIIIYGDIYIGISSAIGLYGFSLLVFLGCLIDARRNKMSKDV